MKYTIDLDCQRETDEIYNNVKNVDEQMQLMFLMWLNGYKARDAQIDIATNLSLHNNKQAV